MTEVSTPIERLQVAARLRLAVTRLNRRLRAEGDVGLSPSATAALSSIGRHGPLSLGGLAAMEGVKPPVGDTSPLMIARVWPACILAIASSDAATIMSQPITSFA